MSRSSRLWRPALALVLVALAWLIGSLVRVSSTERAVAPAGDRLEPVPEVDSGAARGFAQPTERSAADALDLGAAGPSSADDLRAAMIGRVEGLELPHGYGAVRVALWPDGLNPDCRQLASAGADTFPLRVVQVAPDGSFRFDDLPAQDTFQLRAGGAAHISLPLEQAVRPSTAVVVLRLVRTKGLEIEIIGRDGEQLRTHPDLVLPGASFGGLALMAPGALLETWEEQLAVVPGAGCDVPEPKLGVRFLVRGPPENSALGPIACDLRVAGYDPVSRLLWAEPVVESVPRVRIELDPTASEWGSLELHITGWSTSIRDEIDPDTLVGSVHLRYDNGASLTLPLRGAAGSRTWDGIPAGRAEASFVSAAMFRWPRDGSGVALHIAEQPSSFVVDLAESGALSVSLDPERAGPAGSHRIALRWGARFGVIPLETGDLPRFLPVVEPGEWSLFAMRGADGEAPAFAPREDILVEAGAVTEVVLSAD